MMEIPSTEWGASTAKPEAQAPLKAKWTKTGKRIEHTFTHFHLELEIWAARVPADTGIADKAARWVQPRDLAGAALPSVMRKIVAVMS
jgi:A/G-specific adenine glycosylase